jgi:FKBP-type peptidyl-prolyl cis-trans isomerase
MVKMKEKFGLALAAGLLLIIAVSCDPAKKYEKEEAEKIAAYLNNHPDLDYIKKESGLYYCDTITGTGDQVLETDSVYFDYILRYLDGYKIADTNYAAVVGVGQLITGVDEALGYMKDGGWSKIVVPSYLGYGNTGIFFPAWTPLLYDLNITKLVHNK